MYFFKLRKYFLSTLLLELFCHILQPIQADILSTQRKNRNAYTFRFPVKRETGFEPATPTLARLYSTPEPLAHFSFFILLSARWHLTNDTIQELPSFVNTYFQFFSKKSKNIYDSPNFRPPGGSSRFTPVPTVRPRVASYLRCRYEATRGRPRSSILSPLSLQNRAQHILII